MLQKHEIYAYFFYNFSKVFAEKYIKYIPQEMKNGLSLTKQKLQVIMYYIITWAFISSLADKTNAPLKNKQYFHFSSPLKDTEIFLKLLFWTLNSSCVPQLFLIIIYIFDDSSDLFKTENGHHSINLTDRMFVHLQSLLKHKAGNLLEGCI